MGQWRFGVAYLAALLSILWVVRGKVGFALRAGNAHVRRFSYSKERLADNSCGEMYRDIYIMYYMIHIV